MKILIEIPDAKVDFGLEVLKSLSFVKEVKPLSQSTNKLWEDLKVSAEEIRQHKLGKAKLKTAQELLNEL